jgi:hypothetical protein
LDLTNAWPRISEGVSEATVTTGGQTVMKVGTRFLASGRALLD